LHFRRLGKRGVIECGGKRGEKRGLREVGGKVFNEKVLQKAKVRSSSALTGKETDAGLSGTKIHSWNLGRGGSLRGQRAQKKKKT